MPMVMPLIKDITNRLYSPSTCSLCPLCLWLCPSSRILPITFSTCCPTYSCACTCLLLCTYSCLLPGSCTCDRTRSNCCTCCSCCTCPTTFSVPCSRCFRRLQLWLCYTYLI